MHIAGMSSAEQDAHEVIAVELGDLNEPGSTEVTLNSDGPVHDPQSITSTRDAKTPRSDTPRAISPLLFTRRICPT